MSAPEPGKKAAMSTETGDHSTCAQQLRDGMDGIDVTVSAAVPLIVGPYTTEPFACPHGTLFWIEPTSEQVAKWRAEEAG